MTETGGRKVERLKVGILMGSESDLGKMQKAAQMLEEMEFNYEMRILSAVQACRSSGPGP